MYKSYRTTNIRKHTSYCIGFLFWYPFFYKACFVYLLKKIANSHDIAPPLNVHSVGIVFSTCIFPHN